METYFVIYSRKHTRHEPVWWAPESKGYVMALEDAGRYNGDEAAEINLPPNDIAIPVASVLDIAPLTLSSLEARLAGRKSSLLDGVDRAWMLRNAIASMSNANLRCRPLWAVVRDLCGVGSTTASEICRELNWNPEAKATAKLP